MNTIKNEVTSRKNKKAFLLTIMFMLITCVGSLGVAKAMSVIDEDNDGYSNGLENSMGTNLNSEDTDNDGLIDSDDPNPLKEDADEDGLTDSDEFTYATSSYLADTDGDGYTDKEEINNKTNPLYEVNSTITRVTVTGPDSVNVGSVGHSYTATVTGNGTFDNSVTWKVEDNTSVGTKIDENTGVLTLADDEKSPNLTIIATSVQDPTIVGTLTVTVNSTIMGVTVTGPDSIDAGAAGNYVADITGAGNFDNSVTWTLVGSQSATSGTNINKNGELTVADDEMASSLTIKATSVQDNSVIDQKIVAVNPTITGVEVTGKDTVDVGTTGHSYTADVTGTGNFDDSVAWTVEGSKSVTNGTTIDPSGVLTVADDEMSSSLTVKATSARDNSIVDEKAVAVNSTITGITVTGQDDVDAGSTGDYVAEVAGNGDFDNSVKWTVEGSKSATSGTTIDDSGTLTVADDEMAQSLTITATSVQDISAVAQKDVTVNSTVIGLTVDGPGTVDAGSSDTYVADVTGTGDFDSSVEWTVTYNKDQGTVIDASGVLTVAPTETAQTITVRATSKQDTNLYDEKDILTITEPVVTGVVLNDEDADGIYVTNEAVIATITFGNVPDVPITVVELDGVEGEQVVENSYSYFDEKATVEVAFNIPGDGDTVIMGAEQTIATITGIVQNGAIVDVIDKDILSDIAAYGIYNADQLQDVGKHPKKADSTATFLMMNDIFMQVGGNFSPISGFGAEFDGQGYTIFDYYSDTNGLFSTTTNAVIKNVNISGTVDSTSTSVGLLVGKSSGTNIEKCSSSGTVNSTGDRVGGLVGYSNSSSTIGNSYTEVKVTGDEMVGGLVGFAYDSCTISGCHAEGEVDGTQYVGGLVGQIDEYSAISNSHATGAVTSSGNYVGGLVGQSDEYSAISNSHATGVVTSSGNYVGGLVGNCGFGSTITTCYATGAVTGNERVGGLLGHGFHTETSDSYATGEVDGTKYVGGLVGYSVSGNNIINCYATGKVTGTEDVGGLVGYDFNSGAESSYATGDVIGTEDVGGLVGYSNLSAIWHNYATGDVTGERNVGGLVGNAELDFNVSHSYATGTVTGDSNVGGLVGYNNNTTIWYSYATGAVSGDEKIGGLVGYNFSTDNIPSMNKSYATGDVTGTNDVGGLVGLHSSTISNSISGCYAYEYQSVNNVLVIEDESLAGTGDTNNVATYENLCDSDWQTSVLGTTFDTTTYDDCYPHVYKKYSTTELVSEQVVTPIKPPVTTTVVLDDEDGDGLYVTNEAVIATITFGNVPNEPITVVDLAGVEGEQVVENSYSYSDGRATVEVAFNIPGDGSAVTIGTEQVVSTVTGFVQNETTVDVADKDIIADITAYGIYNADQLQYVEQHPKKADSDALFLVMNDFTMPDGGNFIPISDFGAEFDGQEYKISNFYSDTNGLFATTNNAEIKNVNISGTVNSTNRYVGLLVGHAIGSEIENCSSSGTVDTTEYVVGGLVGFNEDSTITNSYSTANVSGIKNDVGGLVGCNYSHSTISNCYATGNVTSNTSDAGGLVGYSYDSCTISNSYAKGNVTGDNRVGGLVGGQSDSSIISKSYATGVVTAKYNVGGLVGSSSTSSGANDNSSSTISDCYATGNVTSTSGNGTGGLVGSNNYSTISNSYATGDVTGSNQVGGLVGCTNNSSPQNYSSTITNCYAIGDVNGTQSVGGLVGYNSSSFTISNSYATGDVDGTQSVGGLVGVNDESTVSNCYATGNVDGTQYVAGLVGSNSGAVTNSYAYEYQYVNEFLVKYNESLAGTGATNEVATYENLCDSDWQNRVIGTAFDSATYADCYPLVFKSGSTTELLLDQVVTRIKPPVTSTSTETLEQTAEPTRSTSKPMNETQTSKSEEMISYEVISPIEEGADSIDEEVETNKEFISLNTGEERLASFIENLLIT